MISLKNISYETNLQERILDGISLEIEQGEFVVIAGKSGSGKSTLGSVINGLIPHYYGGTLEGEVHIKGSNTREMELAEIGRVVGSVFQDPRTQFFMLKAFDEASFGCGNMSLEPREVLSRAEAAMGALGILHLKERNIFELSSGEKQKLALASCCAMQPEVYLFDEPTANLDLQSVFDLREILGDLKKEGKTILVLEHRLFYLSDLLDRMIVLEDGKIKREYSGREFSKAQAGSLCLRHLFLEDLDVQNPGFGAPESPLLFEVRKLSYSSLKSEREYLWQDVSFSAHKGEIIGIVGDNGAGKTSLAKVCAGLLREKTGSVWIEEKELKYGKRSGKIYFVMQDSDFQLFSNRVEEELDIGRRENPLTEDEKRRVLSTLEIFLFRDRHPMTLSRGQKQRLTLAAAFAGESKVIFLDEPTSGLDKHSMDLAAESIMDMADSGRLFFIISHDYEFLLSVCSRILHLKDGGIADDFSLCSETKGRLWEILSKGR